MKLIRNTIAAGIAVAAISLGACSSQHGATGTSGSNGGGNPVGSLGGNPGQDNLGEIGMHLLIAPGVNLFSLNWTISNGTNSYPGIVQIGDAQSVEFVQGGIQAGSGYIVTLSGSDSAGDPCTGASAAVTVIAGATSSATVIVTCTAPTDSAIAADVSTGTIAVDAGVIYLTQSGYVCPGITSITISPAEVTPGQAAVLTSASTSGSGGTETINWTAVCPGFNDGGTTTAPFSAPTAANTTFNCPASGVTCSVTLAVALAENGPDGGPNGVTGCTTAQFTSYTETIQCESGVVTCGSVGTAGPNTCPTGDGGTFCTTLSTDNNNCGTCGTICTGGTTCGLAGDAGTATCNAPPPVPCTTSGQVNCVACQGNASGLCSPTEASLVSFDIDNQSITVPAGTTTPDVAAGCYTCLVGADIIDDTVSSDTGHECGDIAGSFTGDGGGAGANNAGLCLKTLNCILDTGCGAVIGDSGTTTLNLDNCYCGAGGGSPSACASAGSATNGACKTDETNGLYPNPNDSTDILKDYTDTTEPSGVANQIFHAAVSACPQCFTAPKKPLGLAD